MVAKKRTTRVVSSDKHEEIDPDTQDRLVVETITTTTTTTTKKRIYVNDSNVDLTNIQNLLDDKTDTYAWSAIANTASDHSCQSANSTNKKRKENENLKKSANDSYSPLSSTKVSNEIQSDEDNDSLITFDKKNNRSASRRSAISTKTNNQKNNSPNLSCIPCDKTKDSSKSKKSKDLKKKTETISSKIMPKTPKNFKEKRIEDLINQYISVGTVKQKAKTQSGSNYIPNSINDNHNLSDIAEASFEANNSAGISSIVQDVNPIALGNDEIEINTEKTVTNIEKTPKQTPTTRSQKGGKRGKSVTKSKSQPDFQEDDNDKFKSDKANKSAKSVPSQGKETRKILEEEKEPESTASKRKNTRNAAKERAVIEKQVSTAQLEPIETEQTEAVKSDKRQGGRKAAEKTHEESKPTNKRSQAENSKIAEQTKSVNVDEPSSDATDEKFESNKRSSKRKRVPDMQQSVRRASLEKLYEKEIKKNPKAKPSKSKKLPKTKNNANKQNDIDELPVIPMPMIAIKKEASFEANNSADCSSIVQDVNPIKLGNDEIDINTEKTVTNIEKTPKQTPTTRSQKGGKRGKSVTKSKSQPEKSAKVKEPISEAIEEKSESNKRSSKRKRVPNMQQSHIDELPVKPMDDNEPIMPINKDLFDHKIAIYSPSSRKNFQIDGDSNVIIPEALIKSKLMGLSNAPDEWMNEFNGKKQYKVNASHRLRLFVPDTMENVDLNTNAKGGGDVLSRIGKLRKPILVHEFGTPTKN